MVAVLPNGAGPWRCSRRSEPSRRDTSLSRDRGALFASHGRRPGAGCNKGRASTRFMGRARYRAPWERASAPGRCRPPAWGRSIGAWESTPCRYCCVPTGRRQAGAISKVLGTQRSASLSSGAARWHGLCNEWPNGEGLSLQAAGRSEPTPQGSCEGRGEVRMRTMLDRVRLVIGAFAHRTGPDSRTRRRSRRGRAGRSRAPLRLLRSGDPRDADTLSAALTSVWGVGGIARSAHF
jgi:hypothetical protein